MRRDIIFSWYCHEIPMRLQWDCHGNAMGLSWDFHEKAMGLHRDCLEITWKLPRNYQEIISRLPTDCGEIANRLPKLNWMSCKILQWLANCLESVSQWVSHILGYTQFFFVRINIFQASLKLILNILSYESEQILKIFLFFMKLGNKMFK